MQQREAERALAALAEYAQDADRERLFREAGEFTDPFDFADQAINNLSAIRYAMGAGLPVTEWAPATKNVAEHERVLRAMRQWDEQSRLLLTQLASGTITEQQFYNALVDTYIRQSFNAYIAGRRAVGDITPLTPEEVDVLEDAIDDDVARLGQFQADMTDVGGMTMGGLIASIILDPTNYFGSGLPGDPFAPKKSPAAVGVRGGQAASSQLRNYSNRMDQYGASIRSRSHLGELGGLSKYSPPEATLVWWTLGPADHCIDCVRLSDMSPFYQSALNGLYPGSGHTRCGARCQCMLEYDLPATVCMDPFSGPGLADFGIHGEYGDAQFLEAIRTPLSEVALLESAALPGKVNVFIQEAASCSRPMDIANLNGQSVFSTIDDASAFNWDSDVAYLMRGHIDEALTWDEVLKRYPNLVRMFEGLRGAIPGGMDNLRFVTYEADGARFAAAFKDTGDALRLEVGAVFDGLPSLEPEFNLKVLDDLADRARARGIRLEINGEMATPGMRRWLDTLGADHLAVPGRPGDVVIDFPRPRHSPAPLRGVAPEPVNPVDAALDRFRNQYAQPGMEGGTEFGQIIDSATGEVIVDRAGVAYAQDIGSDVGAAVEFTLDEQLLMRGNIVTHIHPYDFSVSTGDILQAMRMNVAQMRAESPGFRFIIEPGPGGWFPEGITKGDLGAFKIRMDDEWNVLVDARFGDIPSDLSFDEGLAWAQRAATRDLAERYGWRYTELDVGPHVPVRPKAGAEFPTIPPVGAPLRGVAPAPPTPMERLRALGVNVDWNPALGATSGLERMPEEVLDRVVTELERLRRVHPSMFGSDAGVPGTLRYLSLNPPSDELIGKAYANTFGSNLMLNERYFGSVEGLARLDKRLADDFATGHSFGGKIEHGVIDHELGHNLDFFLAKVLGEDPVHGEAYGKWLSRPMRNTTANTYAKTSDRERFAEFFTRWLNDAPDLTPWEQEGAEWLARAGIKKPRPLQVVDPVPTDDLAKWLPEVPAADIDRLRAFGVRVEVHDMDTFYDPATKTIHLETGTVGTHAATHEAGHALDHALGWPSQSPPYKFLAKTNAPKGYGDAEVWATSYQVAHHPGATPMWWSDSSPLGQIARESRTVVDHAAPGPHPHLKQAASHRGINPAAKDPVAALPQWPEMSLLKDEVPAAVKAVGGVEQKRILIDPANNRWLAKTREEAIRAEVAAAQIGHELGLRLPPVRAVEWDGATLSLQPMVPGQDLTKVVGATMPKTGLAPAAAVSRQAATALTEEQARELAGQAVLDFLIANADTHAANWVVDAAGHLWGIDKGLGFRGVVATSSNPATFYTGAQRGLFGEAIGHAAETGFFLKTSPDDIGRVLDRLDAMDMRRLDELLRVSDGLPSALGLIEEPFGTFKTRLKALQKRKDKAREGFAELIDNALSNAGKNISPEWRAWREAGSTFVRRAVESVPPNAAVVPPAAALPPVMGTEAVPAMWRSTVSKSSTVGNNRATWQLGFSPAASREVAEARMRALLPNLEDATLDGFDLPQMNVMLARLEHLDASGVDLGLLRGLSDYSTVPPSEWDFSIGLTLGQKVHLKHDNAWKFNPVADSHPTAYDDIGGLLAHEYGHVVFHQLTPGAQTQMIDLYKAHKATAADDISTYAVESLDEWFGEAFTAVTSPGYVPGTLRYDTDLWSILAADGKVRLADLPATAPVVEAVPPVPDMIAKGPYKATTEMVPTATLRQYADIDIKSLDQNLVKTIREDMAAHGMREPVVLQFSRTENRLALTDGAARLAIAHEMGMKYVPARVTRSSGPFSGTQVARSKSVPKPTFPDDYVPLNIKPSQVIPEDQWVAKRVVGDDLATAPPMPPLGTAEVPPFTPPPSAELAVKPLPPGKKMGGMSSKQIYVDPAGQEWLVKPKKVFVEDVELSRAAIDIEAAITPLANRVGINASPVVSTTIDYPWVPGADLKTVGASIQPIVPGITHLPTVPVPEGATIPIPAVSPGTAKRPKWSEGASPNAGSVAWDELSDENLNDLAQNQMFDWFIGNDDGHIGQFLLDSNGKIVAIDKDAAFWELPSQYAQGDAIPEYGKHIVHTWWNDMTPERLSRIKPRSIEQVLDRIDAIPDAEYRRYIEPHLDTLLAHPNGVKMSREQWADAILTRKRNMRADFTAYYQRQLSDLAEAGMPIPSEWKTVMERGFREASPHRRPLPNPATKQNLRDAEQAWLEARNTVQDVLDGKVDVSIGWNVGEFNLANENGLKYRKIGGFRFHATSEEPLDRIAAYLAEPGHSSMDDGFWAAMGYTPEQIETRNTLQRLMRPVQNPTEGLPMTGKGGFVEVPVGDPIGPPKALPDKPWLKPADHQMYVVPGSSVPLNGPRVEWSGKVPDEPAAPIGKATKEQIDAAQARADRAYGDPEDVADGKREAVWSWTKADMDWAITAGLHGETYKGARIITATQAKMDELKAMLDEGIASSDDRFWRALGYSERDLDAIDTAAEIGKTKRIGAGVMIVEPDGRMWFLAPRNEWAGYQNTVIKGGVDPGEALADAAVREVREEAGFSVELDSFLGDYDNTDGTAITRMYIGHRTGGGPLYAKQKETHELRLLTREEAEQMLTRYKKPDARDQAILADTMERLNGTPGLIDFSIPADEVAEFAAKVGPAETGAAKFGARPPSTPESPSPKYAINPDPVQDLPPAVVFGYNDAYVKAGMGSFTESPASSTKFPYNATTYKNALGEPSAFYWKKEFSGGKQRIFWANSKKQVSDPKLRFDYAVAQVARLGDALIDDASIELIRVNETLFENIPQLKEMLIAAGGKPGGVGKYLDIDRNSFISLRNAIVDQTPLGSSSPAPFIPTAPMTPAPTAVTAYGVEVEAVAQHLDGLKMTPSSVADTLKLEWTNGVTIDVQPVFDDALVAIGSLAGMHPTHARSFALTNLAAVYQRAVEKGYKRIVTHVSWSDVPGMNDMLTSLGFVNPGLGYWEIQVADFAKTFDQIALDMSSNGHAYSLFTEGIPGAAPAVSVAPTSNLAAAYDFEPDMVTAAVTSGPTGSFNIGSVTYQAPHNTAATFSFNRMANRYRWKSTEMVASGNDARGLWVKGIVEFGDRVDIDPAMKELLIESPVVGKMSATVKQMLLDNGAKWTASGNDLVIGRTDLIALRDAIVNPLAKQPSYLAPGPLPTALAYEPAALGTPMVTPMGGGAFEYETAKNLFGVQPMHDGLRLGPLQPLTTFGNNAQVQMMDSLAAIVRLADDYADPANDFAKAYFAGLPPDVRAALLNRGGVEKAGMIVMSQDDLFQFAAEVQALPPLGAVPDVAMVTPPVNPSITSLVGTDSKVMYAGPKGDPKPMTNTDYGSDGDVTWWRIGNDIEVAKVNLSTDGWNSFAVKLGKVFDDNPKLKVVRIRDSGEMTNTVYDSLDGPGLWTKYNVSGRKIDRATFLSYRDQIVANATPAHTLDATIPGTGYQYVDDAVPVPDFEPDPFGKQTTTVVPEPPAPPAPTLASTYGWNVKTAGSLGADFTKQSGAYSKAVWQSYAENGPKGTVTNRYAELKTELVWDRIFGDPDMLPDAAVRSLYNLTHKLEGDAALTRIRFENIHQLPPKFREMLDSHGATLGDNVLYLPRENAIELGDAIGAELLGDTAGFADDIPVPTAVTDADGTIWEVAGGDSGTGLVGMQPQKTDETLNVKTYKWSNNIETVEKLVGQPDGSWWMEFSGVVDDVYATNTDVANTVVANMHRMAKTTLHLTDTSLAVRAQVFDALPTGQGKALKDALIAGGAAKQGEFLVFNDDAMKALIDAVENNTKFVVPAPGGVGTVAGPTPTPANTGAKLSAQYGYDHTDLTEWQVVGALTAPVPESMTQYTVGGTPGSWMIEGFETLDGRLVPGISHYPQKMALASLDDSFSVLYDLATLKHLDAVVQANPGTKHLVWATEDFHPKVQQMLIDAGGFMPPESGLWRLKTDALHALALKIDNDEALEGVLKGSAAMPANPTSVHPDILPTLGFNDWDTGTAALIGQNTPTMYPMAQTGTNATSYVNGDIYSEWEWTPQEVIWKTLAKGQTYITDFQMRQAAIAELRRLGKHVVGTDQEGLLVGAGIFVHNGEPGEGLRSLLVGYGGKTQQSGAVYIKREALEDLLDAMDDQLALKPISGAATGTIADVGGYAHDELVAIMAMYPADLAMAPGKAMPQWGPNHFAKDISWKGSGYEFIYGWTPDGNIELKMLSWSGIAAPSAAEYHAAAAYALQQASDLAGQSGVSLVIRKQVLDDQPWMADLANNVGGIPGGLSPAAAAGDVGDIVIEGYTTAAAASALAANSPPFIGLAPAPQAAAVVAAPSPATTAVDDLIVAMQTGSMPYDEVEAALKAAGHPGVFPDTYGKGTPVVEDFFDQQNVIDAWNEGTITTEQADVLIQQLGAETNLTEWVGQEFPDWMSESPIKIEGGETLAQQVTGKSLAQLEAEWNPGWNGWTYTGPDAASLPYSPLEPGGPTKGVTPGVINYKARRVITAPEHGKGNWNAKGKWSGGSAEQRAEVMYLAVRKQAHEAATNVETKWSYTYGQESTPKPQALFVHSDALRVNPGLKQVLDEFGAKKKNLKVGNVGTGWEVPADQIKALDEFLQADAPLAGKAADIAKAPPPPPPASAAINAPPDVSPTMAHPNPVPEPPIPTATMASAYGYDQQMFLNLADDADHALNPSVKVITQSKPGAKTSVFTDQWANKVNVTWANEIMSAKTGSRVLRVRSIATDSGAVPFGSSGQNALLATLDQMETRLQTVPNSIAVIIDKKALASMPGIEKMLKDAAGVGWKETASSYTLQKAKLLDFMVEVRMGKASWMPEGIVAQSVDAAPSPTVGLGQTIPEPTVMAPPTPIMPPEAIGPPPAPREAPALTVGGVPKKPTPSFIYGYDDAAQKTIGQTLTDVDRPNALDALDKPVQEGVQAFTTAYKGMEAHWSVSKSGKAVGWTKIVKAEALSDEEARDAAFAMLRHIAAQGSVREKFFISPAAYDHIPGLRQMLLDAGGKEASYPNLGTAVEIDAAGAGKMVAALDSNTMSGLKVQISTTSDYLGFEMAAVEQMGDTPKFIDAYHHQWKTGDVKPTVETVLDLEAREQTWQHISGGSNAEKAMAAMAELKWAADQGIESITIMPAVVHDIAKFDKWLLSMGATFVDGNLVLDGRAINAARKHVVKNALPELLGGSKMPYAITDEMNSSATVVVDALTGELVTAAGAGKKSTFVVGQPIETTWSKSDSNIYWSGIDRGQASIGAMRTAAAAQLRSFLNDLAQNGSLRNLDIDSAVLAEVPALRAVLLKYGAKEVPASTTNTNAFISLDRSKALKMRNDLEAELGQASAGVGTTFIAQHNAIVKWPSVEDLKPSTTPGAIKAAAEGQTRKAVFVDADGNEWLFKPGASGRGAATDKAVAQLAEMLGLPVPPVRVYTLEFNGSMVQGSLQKMVPGKGMKESGISSPKDLSPAQTEDLLKHSVLDWLVNNDDAHIGNWIIDPDGRLWAIDKARGWSSFHTAHDVLDTMSEGNMGGTPWLFKFFRDARADPSLLHKIRPQTVAQPLRILRGVPDDEFLRIVDPVAELLAKDRARAGAYYGKKQKLLDDMLRRKHEAAQDFERYFQNEIRTIAKQHPGKVPEAWTRWLDQGGTINLDATPKDLLLERKAMLDAKYGASGAEAVQKAKQMLADNHLSVVGSKVRSYFGGAGQFGATYGHWGAENIIPIIQQAGKEHLVAEWSEINEWAMLNIVYDKTSATDRYAATVRSLFDEERGVFRVFRTTDRYASEGGPEAYIPGYQRDGGFRSLVGVSMGRGGDGSTPVWVGASSSQGVVLYIEVRPDQVFSNLVLGFNPGEGELLIRDITLDQIVHIRRGRNPMSSAAEIMAYRGPVVASSTRTRAA